MLREYLGKYSRRCYPVFLDHETAYNVFDSFCMSILLPVFHHVIELAEEGRFGV